ncbi:MAG: hypothetical protein NW217_05670 [Hyphomicrobiaceae bacterium]|nr:hypothetical protein [Hyphomicrobiaceae bacterium]
MDSDLQLMLVTVGVAAIAVFIIDYFANLLAFGNRFINAIASAVVLMVALAGALYLRGLPIEPEVGGLAAAGAIMFVIGWIGNMIAFSGRFTNALVTALLFALAYGALGYFFLNPHASIPV